MKKIKISLADANPVLAKQWHPTKNGTLTPHDVAYGTRKNVWWYLLYHDAKTGKTFPFEWQATVNQRSDGAGCPFLNGRKVWIGFNDLASQNEELAKQWHPTKNGLLTPFDVTVNSGKIVWWYLQYDDPVKGHFNFEWQAAIYSRNGGMGCPFLANKAVWVGFNDLASCNKELAAQWHPTKNGKLSPKDVTFQSRKKVWWYLPYDDPEKGHFDFEWQAAVCDRARGDGCPYLSNRLLWPSYNSLAAVRSDLVAEWDCEKNGDLTPWDVLAGTEKKVWWKCKKGHSWIARIDQRCNANTGCPHCNKEQRTSLPEQTVFYYIKKHFDDALNGDKATFGFELDIYIPSKRVAIEYDGEFWHKDIDRDLKKNQKCKENDIQLIRIREAGCPTMTDAHCVIINVAPNDNSSLSAAICKIATLINVRIDVNVERDSTEILQLIEYSEKKNSLLALCPDLAKEWHSRKNGNLRPECISAYSGQIVWWYLPYEDPTTGHQDFEWQASVRDRTSRGDGCPYLSGARVWPTFNSLLALNPDLAKEWDFDKNKGLSNKRGDDVSTPDKVTPGSHQIVWWKCSVCNYEWKDPIEKRNMGRGCPECYRNSRKPKTIPQSDLDLSPNEQSA
jgi:hypothetical protein